MATPGLVFRIGGVIDPTLKGALAASVAQGQASAVAMNRSMKLEIASQQKMIMGLTSADAAEIIGRSKYVQQQQLKLRLLQSEQLRELNRLDVASTLKAQEEMLVAVAMGNGASSRSASLGGHGGGGITGIIRESIVIMREISMGRGTGRIGGSITLLAQYLGVLKLAVKSTATEQLLASAAATKLSKAMAVEALAARGTAAYTELFAAAQAQEAVAANAATEANIALASATVTLNPLFFIAVGVIAAAGAAAFFLWRHFSYLARASKDLRDETDLTTISFSEQAKVLDEANKKHADGIEWLNKQAIAESSLKDAIDEQIKSLREQAQAEIELARARGASRQAITAMELEAERKELDLLKQQAQAAEEKHHADFLATQDAQAQLDKFNNGTGFFSGSTLAAAKKKKDESAAVADEAQAEFNKHVQPEIDTLNAAASRTPAGQKIGMTKGLTFLRGFMGLTGDETIPEAIAKLQGGQMDFKSGGKDYHQSMAQSRDAYQANATTVTQLENLSAQLEDMVKNNQTLTGKDLEAYNAKKKERDDLAAKLGIDEKYKPLIDAAQRGRGGDILGLTDRQRAGAQISGPAVAMVDQQKITNLLLGRIDKNTSGGRQSRWGGTK